MSCSKRLALTATNAVVLFATMLFNAAFVKAAQDDLEFKARTGILYDSNRELRTDDTEELQGIITQAGVRYIHANMRTKWKSSFKLTDEQFVSRPDLENDSASLALVVDNLHERSRWTGDIGLLVDTSLATEVQSSGAVRERKDRMKGSIAGTYEYRLSETSWLMGGLSAEEIDYEDIIPGQLAEYSYYKGNAGYALANSETSTIKFVLFESRSLNEDADFESSASGFRVTWVEQLNEINNLSLTAGRRRSRYLQETPYIALRDDELVLLNRSVEFTGYGNTYELEWIYSGEVIRTNAGASRDLVPDSAGIFTDRRQITASTSAHWSSALRSGLNLLYWEQRSEIDSQTNNDTRGYQFGVYTGWRIDRRLHLELKLQRLERELPGIGENAYANRFLLQIEWNDEPISF